ncbi:MAG: TonB-dependent receptor plug domain-containing protein [Candidatus Aminicenantaceae bacterium]
MKKICLILLLFGLSHSIFSQTITIKDKKTKEPIELVSLISERPKAEAKTNQKGQSDITAFKGAEKIIIHRLGYKTETKSYEDLKSLSFELFLQPTPFDMYDIVVSATRWRQTASDVPSEIAIITPIDVELQNPQTAADLLDVSGKVFIQKSQQGGGSPMIRGFATNRLLYTVDGVRMNTAIFRGGNLQNVISLDPFATEKTEVFFGPGSVIYGSDAIGGVMSFQTLTPQFATSDKKPYISGKAEARHSSANKEMTGHFDVNIGWEKWALLTSFSSFDYNHLRQGSHGPNDYLKPYYVQRQDDVDRIIAQDDPQLQIPSAYSQKNFMQKLRFQPNEQWDFQYGFHYSETSSYGRYDRHNRLRNGLPRYAEWNYGPQKWIMHNLSISHSTSFALYDQMTVRLALQSFEESRINRSLNSSEKNIRIEEVEAYSANFDFVKSIGDHNTLYYGMEYIRDDVTSTGINKDISTALPYCQHCGLTSPGPSRYPQATWQSFAAYVNDQYEFSDRFLLQAGLRYNQYILDAEFDTTFYPFPFSEAHLNNGALTGTIGGVYRPSESWVISTNFSTGFRSPNVDDVGKVFDSEPGSVVVPNPDLEAEYAYNIDLSIAKVFDDLMRIDLIGYYTSLQNAMVRRDFSLSGQDYIVYDGVLSRVQAIQNAAVSNVYGLQAVLEIKLPFDLSFSSDFNFQKGEEELDDGTVSPSRHAAPWFGVSRLTYDIDKLTLQFYAVYQGERKHENMPEEEKEKYEIYAADAQGNTYAPGWFTLNLKAMYHITDSLILSAGIENLTDQRYRPYSSGISRPCRNFILSLSTDF